MPPLVEARRTVQSRSLFSLVAVLLAAVLSQAKSPSPTPTESTSLKEKTDQELVEIITGQKLPPQEKADFKEAMKPSPLDRLWEMPPAEAALGFVSDNTDPRADLKIDDPSAKPPKKGEIGLRWIGGGHYAPVRHGVIILKYDGYESQLLISELEISGEASAGEIEQAVNKTDTYPMRRLVAQQTYEILWWLGHIRFSDKTNPAGWEEASTFKDCPTRFWIEPGGTIISGVLTNRDDGPCGACVAKGNKEAYADFSELLLRRLIERSGIQRRFPMPTVGRYIERDDDAKYLHTTPPPDAGNASERKRWVVRLAQILRNPQRQYLHGAIMETLVPISDPLRYPDPEIDDALLAVMHEGLAASAKLDEAEEAERQDQSEEIDIDQSDPASTAKEKERKANREKLRKQQGELRAIVFDGMEAMEKLGFHDAVVAFSELFELAKQDNIGRFAQDNRPLIAAASIAARHAELRPQLAELLRERLSAEGGAPRGTALLEAVWRADLRELTPTLEKLAALPRPTPNPNDVRASSTEKASLILDAWRETDPLTKAKVDALLSSVIGGGNSIPEVLRAEFEALSAEDKFTFRQFINWMRIAGASVQLRYLENKFVPHTPRPDIPYER
ncbi:MAG TPA: hypothetical protein VM940_00065 [Chthoniobacterales bacterium]|jgi:hypothetical protein|nr:hypothetical protein [Chthoniobacterales bacterium]